MGNPKDSKWYATPEALRTRKSIKLSLSDEALEKLKRLGKRYGSRSNAVEQLINKEEEPEEPWPDI